MKGYRWQCVCGRWPDPEIVQPAARGSVTAERGWVIVEHACVCGRTEVVAHDTQNRIVRADRQPDLSTLPGSWAR